MVASHDWSYPVCEREIRGPYIVIQGDRKRLWKDAEAVFKSVWICAENGIDFWVDTSYCRHKDEVIFICKIKVSKELQNLLQ